MRTQRMLLAFLNGCLNLEFGDEAKVVPYLKMRPGDRLDREAKVSAMKEKTGAEKAPCCVRGGNCAV